jgi:hypothetical protein
MKSTHNWAQADVNAANEENAAACKQRYRRNRPPNTAIWVDSVNRESSFDLRAARNRQDVIVMTNQMRKNDEDVIETSHIKTTIPVAIPASAKFRCIE